MVAFLDRLCALTTGGAVAMGWDDLVDALELSDSQCRTRRKHAERHGILRVVKRSTVGGRQPNIYMPLVTGAEWLRMVRARDAQRRAHRLIRTAQREARDADERQQRIDAQVNHELKQHDRRGMVELDVAADEEMTDEEIAAWAL
ncbi:MAG: hypothetical protein GY795_24605 [Desulfobacterales bacterium]|nr:hypothetical protein [Desulfobacterales bacterium]